MWLLGVVTLLKQGQIVSASADLDFALLQTGDNLMNSCIVIRSKNIATRL
jgi:hypothetical protein